VVVEVAPGEQLGEGQLVHRGRAHVGGLLGRDERLGVAEFYDGLEFLGRLVARLAEG
jgi:hypothetical protein